MRTKGFACMLEINTLILGLVAVMKPQLLISKNIDNWREFDHARIAGSYFI